MYPGIQKLDPRNERLPKIQVWEGTKKERPVHSVKRLFLVKGQNGCRSARFRRKVDKIAQKDRIFADEAAGYAVGLVRTNDMMYILKEATSEGPSTEFIIDVK